MVWTQWFATQPLLALGDPSRRLYWVFLLSSAVLACWVVWRDKSDALKVLCSPKTWLSRSSLLDIQLLVLNYFLKVLLFLPLLGGQLVAVLWVVRQLQLHLSDAPVLAVPTILIPILFTLVFFILEDASRYGLHRLMHSVSWLWRFHAVHHSADQLTPLTLYRAHPIEVFLYGLRSMVVMGLVAGTFAYLFRGQVSGLDILGVDALGFLFNLMGSNLRHSPVRLGFGWWERFFISPAQHQIHHSCLKEHAHKNYGTCLAVWDRMLGTWLASRNSTQPKFGLSLKQSHSQHDLKQALCGVRYKL